VQQVDGAEQHVVEVEPVHPVQRRLVGGDQLRVVRGVLVADQRSGRRVR